MLGVCGAAPQRHTGRAGEKQKERGREEDRSMRSELEEGTARIEAYQQGFRDHVRGIDTIETYVGSARPDSGENAGQTVLSTFLFWSVHG